MTSYEVYRENLFQKITEPETVNGKVVKNITSNEIHVYSTLKVKSV